MKLATVEDLANRYLDLKPSENRRTAFDRALVAASSHLTSILRTEFEQIRILDTFWLDNLEFVQHRHRNQFYLTQAFVELDVAIAPAPVVKVDPRLEDIANATPVDPAHIRFSQGRRNYEGLVIVSGTDTLNPPFRPFILTDRTYVTIEYTAGFREKNDQTGPKGCSTRVFRDVPDWLHEAALQIAREVALIDVGVEESDSGKRTRESGTRKRSVDVNLTMAENLLQRYIRFHPTYLKPLFTEDV